MLGIDVTETQPHEIFAVTWKVGLLPLGKYEELHLTFTEAYQPMFLHADAEHKDPVTNAVDSAAMDQCPTCREAGARAGVKLAPLYREFVRWGVRGWDAPRLPFETELEPYGGQTYACVKRSVVERLARVGHGELIRALALAVMKTNTLSAEDVLGFK